MNQILFNKLNDMPNTYSNNKKTNTNYDNYNNYTNYNYMSKNKIFKRLVLLFIISFLLILFLFFYNIYNNIKYEKNKNFSNSFSKRYEIYRLFAVPSYDFNYENNNNQFNDSDILGNIIIPKLNINYPFFYGISEDLLEIFPCRFSGNIPNAKNSENNLCIAGHNYGNDNFFSNIYKLEKKDLIKIKDLYNNTFNYSVYKTFEIDESDIQTIIYPSSDITELTLLTCNNYNNKRIIVKAKLIKK